MVLEKYYSNSKLPNHTRKGYFWRRDNLKLLQKFKSFTVVDAGDGKTCYFWTGNLQHQPLAISSLELFSLAKNKVISVHKVQQHTDFPELFHLHLSQIALNQMHQLQSELVL